MSSKLIMIKIPYQPHGTVINSWIDLGGIKLYLKRPGSYWKFMKINGKTIYKKDNLLTGNFLSWYMNLLILVHTFRYLVARFWNGQQRGKLLHIVSCYGCKNITWKWFYFSLTLRKDQTKISLLKNVYPNHIWIHSYCC